MNMDDEAMESTEVDTLEASGDTMEPAGESYTIIVDGDEQQVSLSELRDGYQRQADYTRKTQDLASERKRLQQAEAIVSSLESDPAGTLTALQDAFGVSGTPAPQAPVQADPYDTDWFEGESQGADPTDQRIAQLEARLEQQDRLHRKEQVEKQVAVLKDQYGDFDANDLYQHALTHRIGNLEAALTHMRFGDVAEKANKLEKEQERLEAKRGASVVEPTGSKQAGTTAPSGDKPGSIREAFALAKKQLAS